MATFKKFEDIEAWQDARKLTEQIYRLTSEGSFARDFGLRDQIRRAAVSVMANIAEGFGRGGNKEFSLFLGHARGSLAELKSHLFVAMDTGYISSERKDELSELAGRTEALICGLIRYLASTEKRGSRMQTKL
jgi:four helix bundle protein